MAIARKRRIERRRKPGVAANNERLKYTSKVDNHPFFWLNARYGWRFVAVTEQKFKDTNNEFYQAQLLFSWAFFRGMPGRTHLLGGESPLQAGSGNC